MVKTFLRSLLTAALLWAVPAIAQGPGGGGAGPSPPPSPWIVSGPTISYNNGGITMPSTVTGGTKGVGTINVQNGYYEAGVRIHGVVSATAPVVFSGGVISLNIDSNFAVVANNLALASVASGSLIANATAGSAEPTGVTPSAWLSRWCSSSADRVPYSTGASTWGCLQLLGATHVWTALQTVNLNAATAQAAISGAQILASPADGVVGRVQANAYGAIASFTGAIYGGTAASPTQVLSGTQLTGVNAYAYTGSALVGPIASFRTYAAENITATAWGTKACVATTPSTTAVLTDGFCQFNSGGVAVGSPTGGDKGVGTLNAVSLYVNGTAVTGAGITSLTTDVVATGPGAAVATIQPGVVTYAKIANLGALAVMGRSANSSGVGADIQATAASDAVLRESGSTIGFGTIATGGIANNAVTLAKLATQATNTVLGNATSGSAVPTALAVGTCSTAASALIWTTNTGFGCNTSITAAAVPASGLTGSTLAAGVTASSLTSVGTLTGGATGAGFTVALTTSTITGNLPIANAPSIAANTVLGSIAGGTAAALTATQLTTIPNAFTTTLKGLVPPPGSVTGAVLSDNGTWIAVGGTGTVTSVAAGTGMSFTTITGTGSVAVDVATSSNFYAATANKMVDSAVPYTAVPTPAFSATPTFDFNTAASFSPGAMTANITSMTCNNLKANQGGFIRFLQDGTGSRTTVFCSAFKFSGSVTPVLSTPASSIDYLFYTCLSSTVCPASIYKASSGWLFMPGVFKPRGWPANDNAPLRMVG